jgi:hypothetical protein
MDVVKFTKNMTTGIVKDIDNVEVTPSKSTSTAFQVMSAPLVRLQFQKTVGSTTSAYALPTATPALFWTATLDSDFDHTSAPIAYTNEDFNEDGTWDADANPSYANGQLTFLLNLRTEGALAKLGRKASIVGYLEVCAWTDDTADADLVFSSRIEIRILNVVNPSNAAAIPYDVDTAVAEAIDDAVETHDDAAGAHPTVPTSVTTAIGTQSSLVTSVLTETATKLKAEYLIRSMAKMGDRSQRIRAWVMHSKPWFDLMEGQVSGGATNIADVVIYGGAPGTLGRPVIVTDSPYLVNLDSDGDAESYNVLGLTDSAVVLNQSEDESILSDTVLGKENIIMQYQGEYAYNLRIKGFAYDGSANPNDATIGTSASWDFLMHDVKMGPGVLLICE